MTSAGQRNRSWHQSVSFPCIFFKLSEDISCLPLTSTIVTVTSRWMGYLWDLPSWDGYFLPVFFSAQHRRLMKVSVISTGQWLYISLSPPYFTQHIPVLSICVGSWRRIWTTNNIFMLCGRIISSCVINIVLIIKIVFMHQIVIEILFIFIQISI